MEEVIVALPCPERQVTAATQIRSSVLHSSLRILEDQGLIDRYFDHLDPVHRPAIERLVVGQWLPMDIGIAHYGAVEELGISAEQAYRNGRLSSDRLQKSFAGTLIRALGRRISLWTALPRTPSFTDRLVRGGGATAVYRLGPKAARLEFHGMPIARFRYVRQGWCGIIASTTELVARKSSCRDVSDPITRSVIRIELTWT